MTVTMKVIEGKSPNGSIKEVFVEVDEFAEAEGPEDFFIPGTTEVKVLGEIQIVDNDNLVHYATYESSY